MDGMRRETKALKVILSFETLKREEKRKPAARLTLCEGNGSSGRTGSGRKRQRDIRLRPAHLLGDRIDPEDFLCGSVLSTSSFPSRNSYSVIEATIRNNIGMEFLVYKLLLCT